MIVHHQNHVAGFAGGHTFYFNLQSLIFGGLVATPPQPSPAADHIQGVFGQFLPTRDGGSTFTANNVQGVFGEFALVLQNAPAVQVAEAFIPRILII